MMKNLELINKFLEKSISIEELEDFKKKYKNDKDFREEVDTQLHLVATLKAKSKLIGKENIQSWSSKLLGKRILIYLSVVLLLIVSTLILIKYSGSQKQENRKSKFQDNMILNNSGSNPSLPDTLIEFKTTETYQIEVNESEKIKTSRIEEIKIALSDSSTDISKTGIMLRSKPKLENKFDSCEVVQTFYGPNGTIIKYHPYSICDDPNDISFRIKEFYSKKDIVNCDFLNFTSENSYLGIYRIMFFSIIDKKKNISINSIGEECKSEIEIYIPIESDFPDIELFQIRGDNGKKIINNQKQTVLIEGKLYFLIKTRYTGGFNLSERILQKNDDYIIRIGNMLWNPQIINFLMVCENKTVYYSANMIKDGLFSFPNCSNPKKSVIYLKYMIGDEVMTYKASLDLLPYNSKKGYYYLSKEELE